MYQCSPADSFGIHLLFIYVIIEFPILYFVISSIATCSKRNHIFNFFLTSFIQFVTIIISRIADFSEPIFLFEHRKRDLVPYMITHLWSSGLSLIFISLQIDIFKQKSFPKMPHAEVHKKCCLLDRSDDTADPPQ